MPALRRHRDSFLHSAWAVLWTLLPLFGLSVCRSTGVVTTGNVFADDGVSIAYSMQGRGEPVLVCVHGWCGSKEHWRETSRKFAGTHKVVAIDLAGHGDSGHDRAQWSLDGLARDLVTTVETLDLRRVILVGHSMGGPLSLMAARALPGRVIGVIGVDTLQDADATYSEATLRPYWTALEADFKGNLRQLVTGVLPAGTAPAIQEFVVAEGLKADPKAAVALSHSYVGLNLKKLLADCPVPIRCINAASPNPTRTEVNRRFAKDFDAVLMDNIGHYLMLEKPDEFHALLAGIVDQLTAR